MGDAEEGDINGKTSSILKTTKGDAHARVEKKKVDEGKSKIKAVESDEETTRRGRKKNQNRKSHHPRNPTSTKKTKITPVESSSDSDEAPVAVGKLEKLEVYADEDSDTDLPAPPPKPKVAGLASRSTTKGAHSPPHERTSRTHMLSTSLPPSNFNSDGTRCVLMPGLLPIARTTVIPEKNDMKTKEKNVEKNGKAKVKEPVTSAEEEEEERIKAKKAALKRAESIKAAAPESGQDSPSRASTSKAKATPNVEGSTSKQRSPVKNNCHKHFCNSQAPAQSEEGSVPTDESTATTSISTAPPRRNAANQATQKLHDVIMPDMNSFEQQMKKSRKSSGGVTGMEWDDREMRETSVGKKRKRASEVRSDQMDIDGEREEEDAGPEKKRVKLSGGHLGEGRGGRLGKRKSGRASLMLWARGRVNATKWIM